MLSISLWLIAAALTISVVALSVAVVLDRREQNLRRRQRGSHRTSSATLEPTTALEWGRTLMLGGDASSASRPCPDIIVGPWKSTAVSIEESPRKAA